MPSQKLLPENPQTLTSVNGGSVQIYGIGQRADVSTAILGLDTITKNELKLEIQGYKVQAAMIDGYYKNVDYTKYFLNRYNDWYDDFKQANMVYGIGSDDTPAYQFTLTTFCTRKRSR
eukprot:6483783-Amphidinium_carterae.2